MPYLRSNSRSKETYIRDLHTSEQTNKRDQEKESNFLSTIVTHMPYLRSNIYVKRDLWKRPIHIQTDIQKRPKERVLLHIYHFDTCAISEVQHICQKRPIKETYIHKKRHTKETYRKSPTSHLPSWHICHIWGPIYMSKVTYKRDLYTKIRHTKETYRKSPTSYQPPRYICHIWGPTHLSKETYERDLYT